MRTAYILIGAVFITNLGCHNAKLGPSADSRVFSKSTLSQINAINDAQGNFLQVANTALPTTPSASKANPGTSDQVGQMIQLIQDGKCLQKRQVPDDRYDHPWQAEWQISSETCPVFVYEYSEFNYEKGKWLFNRTLSSRSSGFQSLSNVEQISLRGSLTVSENSRHERLVSGKITYQPFSVDGVGLVRAEIVVTQVSGDSGSVALALQAGMQLTQAVVYWNSSGRFFQMNGVQIEEKGFADMFSSFGLTEIMDRALKMR